MSVNDPTAPGEDACDYVASRWSCRGTGHLWLADEIPAETGKYPCPKCNTETFLRKAKKIAEARHPVIDACPCCEPAGPSGTQVWLVAVDAAMAANPLAAKAGLAAIGRVKVFNERSALEQFTYGEAKPAA
jgi:hypothetical protein